MNSLSPPSARKAAPLGSARNAHYARWPCGMSGAVVSHECITQKNSRAPLAPPGYPRSRFYIIEDYVKLFRAGGLCRLSPTERPASSRGDSLSARITAPRPPRD